MRTRSRSRRWFFTCTILFLGLLCPAPAEGGLVALYKFNDPGNLGLDSSGNGNNATNHGATFNAAGIQGGAVSVDGLTAYLESPVNVDRLALPQMTWGAWAKPTLTNGNRQLLSSDDGGFDRALEFDTRVSGHWGAHTGSGIADSGVTPSTSDWTFIAAVYNQAAGSLTFYVNNTVVTASTNFGPTSHAFFDIGRNPSFPEYFGGLIDNVFVYNEALTSSQIATIRATGFPDVSAVPEPSALALLGAAGAALGGYSWRRRKVAAKA